VTSHAFIHPVQHAPHIHAMLTAQLRAPVPRDQMSRPPQQPQLQCSRADYRDGRTLRSSIAEMTTREVDQTRGTCKCASGTGGKGGSHHGESASATSEPRTCSGGAFTSKYVLSSATCGNRVDLCINQFCARLRSSTRSSAPRRQVSASTTTISTRLPCWWSGRGSAH